jgi:uncharacterized protein (TIGR03437 family)
VASDLNKTISIVMRLTMMTINRLTLAVCCLTLSHIHAQINVLTANYDNDRTNANLQETSLNQSNVNIASFGKIGAFPVDGSIFAQPLYASAVQVAGKGTYNVVFVVTMHNSVYAINADAPQSTVPLWQVNLGPAVPTSVLNFTDILPEVGILSTPVIDPRLQIMYVVSDTLEKGVPVFRIHALSLADGHEMMNGPVAIAATVPGNGSGSRSDGTLPFDGSWQLQRPGLVLLNGTVYLSFGSHEDGGDFHGWLIGYDATNLNHRVAVLNTSPNGLGASIWQTGRAPAIDAAGNFYVATGNGDFDGLSNFGNSVLKLSSNGLTRLDWYTPDQWSSWNDNDMDLGSAGVILVPGTNLLVTGGKSGHLFVMTRDSMGHLGPLNTNAVQSVQVNQSGVFDIALWNSPRGPMVYVQEPLNTLQAYQIADGRLNPSRLSETTPVFSLFSGIAVSANGGTDGTGIVWQTTADNGSYQQPGTLHAFNALDLSYELWNSDMVQGDALGRFTKFVPPTVVNGRVYVPTQSNQLVIYGLKTDGPPETGPPQITAVVNGASFLGDSVAPGEVVVIFGANLGPAELTNAQVDESGHVPAALSGTQVFFDGVAAPILYTSSNQLAALVPFGTLGPNVHVQAMYQDQVSDQFSMAVTPASPAIFAADGTGGGLGAILNQDNSSNTWDNPADLGSIVVMYITGGGQTDPPGDDGKITSDLPYPKPLLPVQVFIDNQPAEILYAGAAPGLVQGVLQINARIPAGVTEGGVTVTIQIGDAVSPNTVMVVVR